MRYYLVTKRSKLQMYIRWVKKARHIKLHGVIYHFYEISEEAKL